MPFSVEVECVEVNTRKNHSPAITGRSITEYTFEGDGLAFLTLIGVDHGAVSVGGKFTLTITPKE